MLIFRDPKLLDQIHQICWRKKPAVFRNPFKNPICSSLEILEGIKKLKESKDKGYPKHRVIASVQNQSVQSKNFLDLLSINDCKTLVELEKHFTNRFEKKSEMGLMIDNFQALNPLIWSNITPFFRQFYDLIHEPILRTVVDLFWGNYSSSFLGLHKDNQEIFAYVVSGKKTILLWPFNYFKDYFTDTIRNYPNYVHELELDYRKYEKDAIRLKANSGDLFFGLQTIGI